MNKQNSADFTPFKTMLSPSALACFRKIFATIRDALPRQSAQDLFEIPLDDVLALDEIENVEAVAQSIREIIQCKVEVKADQYQYFFPLFSSVSIEGGKIRFKLHKEVEEAIALLPAVYYI